MVTAGSHAAAAADADAAEGGRGGSGRKSRANAGARLKDILQQEAKDLKVRQAALPQPVLQCSKRPLR